MRERERKVSEQLNQYWDQTARRTTVPEDGLEDEVQPLAQTVRRLHAQATTLVADSQRMERIWRRIAAQPAPKVLPWWHWRRWGLRGTEGMVSQARPKLSSSRSRLGVAACLIGVLAMATGAGYIQYTSRMVVAQQAPSRPSIYGTPHGTPGPNAAGPVVLAGAVRSGGAPMALPQVRTFASLGTAQAAIPTGNILLGVLYAKTPPGGRAVAIYGPDCNETGLPDLSVAGFDRMAGAIDVICPGAMLYQGKDWNLAGGPPQVFFESPNGRNDRLGWFGTMHDFWIIASIRFYPYYPIPPYATS